MNCVLTAYVNYYQDMRGNMTNKCRREFEEWAKPSSLRRRQQRGDASQYINPTTQLMWATWQAAYDKRTKDAEELVEALEDMLEYSTMCESWQDHEGKAYVERAKQALAKWEAHEQ